MKFLSFLFKRRNNKVSNTPEIKEETTPNKFEALDKKNQFIRPGISFKEYTLHSNPELELPISGGYGFSEEDAIVIELDNRSDGVKLEYDIIPLRTAAQLAMRYCPEQPILGQFRVKNGIQGLMKGRNGRFFDMLNFTIYALSKEDSEYMKNEMEKNDYFHNNPEGKEALLEQMSTKEIAIQSVCWFDITNFYLKR